MIEHVVTAVRSGTRFYLTDESLYSGIPRLAHRFRTQETAIGIATSEEKRNAFGWTAAQIIYRRTLRIGEYSEPLPLEER